MRTPRSRKLSVPAVTLNPMTTTGDLADMFALPPEAAWQTRAACVDSDPEEFMQDHVTPLVAALCARCPVQADCLAYALERDERFGVWGGLSERERRRLKRRRG